MLKLRLYSYAGLLLAIFMFIAPGFSVASDPQSFDGVYANAELGTFYLVNTSSENISDLNEWIQAEVEVGKVSMDKGEQAQNIWISLQQYLANQSAKIRHLENKIMNLEDNARLKAARDLARNVVERERVLISVYFTLKQIADAGGFKGEELIPGQEQSNSIKKEAPSGTAAVKKEPASEKSAIKIEFSRTDALIKDLE